MSEGEITVMSGVSWLHDTMKSRLEERVEYLKEGMSVGLPYHEYIGFVGRHKEAVRMLKITLPELFQDFQSEEDEEDDDLEEIKS